MISWTGGSTPQTEAHIFFRKMNWYENTFFHMDCRHFMLGSDILPDKNGVLKKNVDFLFELN